MLTNQQVITQTQNWIRNVVIGLNLCPFAAHVVKQESVRYIVENSTDTATVLSNLIEECKVLDNDENIATSFIIFPETYTNFYDYLDLVAIAESLLHKEGFVGVYQLASFHPEYSFATSTTNDAADYTNRSIYPMLHLLRESSIDKALENYSNPDDIPERNIKFTREKGVAYMQMLRDTCL
jgi:uncharacterized protein